MDTAAAFHLDKSGSTPEGGRFVVEIAAGGPFFEGHFPGQPVLPAIAQLVLVERLHLLRWGVHAGVSRIENLRFVRRVLPGETLIVRLDDNDDGSRTHFEIRGVNGTVSRGVLVWTGGRRS